MLQVGLTLGHDLDFTLELQWHLGLDLFKEVDLVEVDVEQVSGSGTPLQLPDQGLARRFVPKLEVHKLVPAHLLESPNQLAAVDGYGKGIHAMAVDDPWQPAFPAQATQVFAATVAAGLEFKAGREGGGQTISYTAFRTAAMLP